MKKIVLFIILFVFTFAIYGAEYYICLGSFQDLKAYGKFNKILNDNGFQTISEKVQVKGKSYTRILYNKKFTRIDLAKLEIKKIQANPIIKKYKIKDIWIRPGVISLSKNINTSKTTIKNDSKVKTPVKTVINKKPETKSSTNINKTASVNTNQKSETKQVSTVKNENISNKTSAVASNQKTEVKQENIQKNLFLKVDKDGSGNIIFSNAIIDLNKEDKTKIKSSFTKPEKIFARCYFPASLGKIDNGNFWHELWINGEFKSRIILDSMPDPNWNQIQIWISDEDYKDEMNKLEKGEYNISIVVYKKDKSEIKVKLAKGDLTYIVP